MRASLGSGQGAFASDELQVPDNLRSPHPVVRTTRDAAKGLRPDDSGRISIGPRAGFIFLRVSRDQLHRSLRIANALLSESERRQFKTVMVEREYNMRPELRSVSESTNTGLRSANEPNDSQSGRNSSRNRAIRIARRGLELLRRDLPVMSPI